MARTILLCLVLLTVPLLAWQAPSPASFQFSIDVVTPGLPPDSLTQIAFGLLSQSLQRKGGKQTNTPDWIFYLGLKEAGKGGEVILSVTLLRVLPEEVIAMGKEQEAFYLKMPPEKRASLPKEGKWVREMVSEETMRQFGKPLDQRIVLTPRAHLNSALSRVVDELSTTIERKN